MRITKASLTAFQYFLSTNQRSNSRLDPSSQPQIPTHKRLSRQSLFGNKRNMASRHAERPTLQRSQESRAGRGARDKFPPSLLLGVKIPARGISVRRKYRAGFGTLQRFGVPGETAMFLREIDSGSWNPNFNFFNISISTQTFLTLIPSFA